MRARVAFARLRAARAAQFDAAVDRCKHEAFLQDVYRAAVDVGTPAPVAEVLAERVVHLAVLHGLLPELDD